MVTIKKMPVDSVNDYISIYATDDNPEKYQFTKIYIDTVKTFNCKNEPSTHATVIELKDSSSLPYAENTPLDNYKIPFNEIICSDDPINDIFFIWVECNEQFNRDEYIGYYYNSNFYFTDGKNYYHTSAFTSAEVVKDSDSSDYNYAKSHADDSYTIKSFKNSHNLYIKSTYSGVTLYYVINDESLSQGGSSIAETAYNAARKLMKPQTAFGVTLSVRDFYNLLLNHIDIETNPYNCKVECSEVNFMLAWQGFNLSKTLQDYNQMIYYWNILHSVKTSSSSNCGCNH